MEVDREMLVCPETENNLICDSHIPSVLRLIYSVSKEGKGVGGQQIDEM